jgi:MoaA/NifB/PqqE/SkfB family radical SAM enzyme
MAGRIPRPRLLVEAVGAFLGVRVVDRLRRRPRLPAAMHYIATHRCNARCVMCGIWRQDAGPDGDLSVEELGRLIADPLFDRMRFVGISGGEPFLREDLEPVVEVFAQRCRDLERVSLTTNGLLPRRIRRMLPPIARSLRRRGKLLDVSVSVHGIGVGLEAVYGLPGAFARIEETLEALGELRDQGLLSTSLNCVLLDGNLDQAEALERWAGERKLAVSFVVGEQRERFFTHGLGDAFVGEADQPRLAAFFRDQATRVGQRLGVAVKYDELADMLAGRRERSASCYYAMGGLLLGHDGALYYCSHSREVGSCRHGSARGIYYDPQNLEYRRHTLLQRECLRCPPYTRTRWELEADLHRLAGFWLKRAVLPRLRRGGRNEVDPPRPGDHPGGAEGRARQ